jgi:hypothetical protein
LFLDIQTWWLMTILGSPPFSNLPPHHPSTEVLASPVSFFFELTIHVLLGV